MTSCSAFINLNESTVNNNNGPNFHECFLCVRSPCAESFSADLGPLLWNGDGRQTSREYSWICVNTWGMCDLLFKSEFHISTLEKGPKSTFLRLASWDVEEGTFIVPLQQFKNKLQDWRRQLLVRQITTEKLWRNPILHLDLVQGTPVLCLLFREPHPLKYLLRNFLSTPLVPGTSQGWCHQTGWLRSDQDPCGPQSPFLLFRVSKLYPLQAVDQMFPKTFRRETLPVSRVFLLWKCKSLDEISPSDMVLTC